MRLALTVCSLALVLGACAPHPEVARPSSLDAYKRIVALDIVQSTPGAYCQPGEDMLKSVVILELAIGADGTLLGASVVRANGYPALAQVALDSVKAAAPFAPPESGQVQFLETFLFRQDDCFLIRSLVLK